ncbi:MAG: hypothetical protein ACRCS9_13335 [Hyphomicrobium sp.]
MRSNLETGFKLPVFSSAAACYRLTLRHAGRLAIIAAPWILALMAASFALYWLFFPIEQAALAATATGSTALIICSIAMTTAFGAAIAVPWHRWLLLKDDGDRDVNAQTGTARNNAPFLRRCWHYFAAAVVILIPMLAPVVAVDLLLPNEARVDDMTLTTKDIAMIASLALVFLAMPIVTRVSLMLPARAIEDDATWRDIWTLTRANTWRIFAASALATLPLIVAASYLLWLFGHLIFPPVGIDNGSRNAFAVFNMAYELMAAVSGLTYVTFLSVAYGLFKGKPAT